VLLVNLVKVNWLIDVTVTVPVTWRQEFVKLNVVLESFCWTIGVPKLKASLYVVLSQLPFTRHVALECLTENWVELLDVLLQSNEVTI
jgi:hypothetical protein